jgi:hypothetical protein
MMQGGRSLLCFTVLLSLLGCSFCGPAFDFVYGTPHEEYEKYMNSQIGKHAADVYGLVPYQYWKDPKSYFEGRIGKGYDGYEVFDFKGEKTYRRPFPKRLNSGCNSGRYISVSTLKVIGWGYAPGSDPQQCKRTHECRY